MENRTVTLMIRHKTVDGKWRRDLAARGGNGRVTPGYARIGEKAVPVKDGNYCLRVYENRIPKYVPAGKNGAKADAQRLRLEITSTAMVVAKDAGLEVIAPVDSPDLTKSALAYIQDKEAQRFTEAAAQARNVSSEFILLMARKKKTRIDQIVKHDIYDFHAALRAQGNEDRTVANKHARLASWLTFAGVDRGIDKKDPKRVMPPKPKYIESLPTIYEEETALALLAGADPKRRLCMLLAWHCGLREGELMHLETTDFNWAEGTLRVQAKLKWKFKPKTWEERDIPLSEDVEAEVKAWAAKNKGQTLILATKNRKPNTKLLLALKVRARQVGLNCGVCESCESRKECEEFTLHKFRRTFITNSLREGLDLRTVQAYAGHKDLASTMRYLRPASGVEAQAKFRAIWRKTA